MISRESVRAAMAAVVTRDTVGISAYTLVAVGVWGLAGWAWAAIVAGMPVAAFYLWGEVRSVMGGG